MEGTAQIFSGQYMIKMAVGQQEGLRAEPQFPAFILDKGCVVSWIYDHTGGKLTFCPGFFLSVYNITIGADHTQHAGLER